MKESNNEINKCVKVLMVEDNINYGRLIKKNLQSLKNEKFDVILSNSLKEGLQELAIKDIDIVLLDLNLVDISFIRHCKSHLFCPFRCNC